jgi:glycosyltransferase involved in cell wall biosynthesis
MKKILLLTDIPPCKNLTAGLVLDQLCRFLPHGSVACYAVVSPGLDATLSPDLDWIPVEYCKKPVEIGGRILPGRLGIISSLIYDSYGAFTTASRITKDVVAFGRKNGVDALWCVLQGKTMIRLARPVAKGLGVPLYTQVWDPPFWWLRDTRTDNVTKRLVLQEFDRVLRDSSGCAAASWAMAEQYHADYGTRAVPVIPSLDASMAMPPATRLHDNDELVIGLAGQIYSVDEWEALIAALDSVSWTICDRKVRIRLMGREAHLHADCSMRVEFLGWGSQAETIRLLSEADILYCPYWFDPDFENEARLSFPSKLTTYLAAGRPVLFHGPAYASPAGFLRDNNSGMCCHSLEKNVIIDAIKRMITESGEYGILAQNGSTAFLQHLTLESMQQSFEKFLGL